MATTAQFAATPRAAAGLVLTGDTSRTAPTTVVTIFTPGASGSRIDNIDLVAIGTTIASVARLFLYDGTTYHLWWEAPVLPVAPVGSNAVPVWSWQISSATNPEKLPLILPSTWSLRATINDTQTSSGVKVFARGGDF